MRSSSVGIGSIATFLAVALATSGGCRARVPDRVPGAMAARQAPDSSIRIVIGQGQYTPPEVLRAGVGSLVVAVRRSGTPTIAVEGVTVVVEGGGMQPIARQAGSDGIVMLDSIPVGMHRLRVQRVGLYPYTMEVAVRADCRQSVEVYLEAQMNCLFGPCRDAPARATITTCPPAGGSMGQLGSSG